MRKSLIVLISFLVFIAIPSVSTADHGSFNLYYSVRTNPIGTGCKVLADANYCLYIKGILSDRKITKARAIDSIDSLSRLNNILQKSV
jgi:hypothetical protein